MNHFELNGKLLENEKFIEELKKAIISGKETDYYYDGEDEVPYEKYNEDFALKQVIKVLEKYTSESITK